MNRLCMGCMRQVESIRRVCPYCGYSENSVQIAPHHIRPRSILNGKYLIGKVIGEGGFGITYLAYDINLELKVAIKEYYPMGFVTRDVAYGNRVFAFQGSGEEYFRTGIERFLDEAKSLAKFINLAGIVMVKDFFKENGTAYIVMEYLEGKTLKAYLREKGGLIPASEVFEMMKPVIESLIQVHQAGIIHRDISPENIMILKDGKIKLLDFGAARAMSEEGDKSLSVFVKPGYAPEEQYRVHGQQGPWTDTYAMCATIYRCITGTTPDEPIERMREDHLKLPRKLGIKMDASQEKVIMKGLSLYPEERFQTMEELYSKLYLTSSNVRMDAEKANRIRELRKREKEMQRRAREEARGKKTTTSEVTAQQVIVPRSVAPIHSMEKLVINGKTTYRRVEPEEEQRVVPHYVRQNEDQETVSITQQEEQQDTLGYIVKPPQKKTGPIVWDFLNDEKKEEKKMDSIVEKQARIREEREEENRRREEQLFLQAAAIEEEPKEQVREPSNRPKIIVHYDTPSNKKPRKGKGVTKVAGKGGKSKKTVVILFFICVVLGIGFFYFKSNGVGNDITTWASGSLSKYGALPGNIINGGSVVKKGDVVYYRNALDQDRLYSYDLTNKTVTKLTNEAVDYLNISDNWIYYQNKSDGEKIYRISMDGKKRHKLVNESAQDITLYGSWIYYIDNNHMIQRVIFNGGDKETVCKSKAERLFVAGDRIYYCNLDDNHYLYRIRLDGTENQCVISQSIENYAVDGQLVYYTIQKTAGIQKYSVSSQKTTQITKDNAIKLNMWNHVLVYINGDDRNRLYYRDMSKWFNKGRILINEGVSSVYMSDRWVYFTTEKSNGMFSRISLSSKERQDFTGAVTDSSKKDFEKVSE